MEIPETFLKLIERFDYNRQAYLNPAYNETQTRLEFIDPFFKALGWDVYNEQGYAEAYKDVVHEDAIKIGQATKAPDYSFRIGGVRKFFLEAKKPAVRLKDEAGSAYQLRRYAWSAKLPLSILTNFAELAVYDCRVQPQKTDKASHSRVLYLTYTEYAERWAEIAGIFSKSAILTGSFDKYAESKRLKRGTAEVDQAFLQEIERWRERLARNLALRNPDLSQRQLNFAVQQTIDRIIFLRICEDRGIESYGQLLGLVNGDQVYPRLFQFFYQADDRYNSGLFHFRPEKDRADAVDALTPNLTIDDKILKEIIKNLYYPDSPYEFSVLSADILGQVYEQFLGKIIRLTPGHRAVVEYKPEVRKAGGVYYTPTYIVDYIVKHTVGKLVAGKKAGPRSAVSQLKILDPACGSGSFLLGAYQFLLDWHLEQYRQNDPLKWARGRHPRLCQTGRGDWKLTIAERKRLLLDHIYGVDIDSQAVEVTKLSLLLKVLEGEDQQSVGQQLKLFQERALPDLGHNIKCGNSLIGPDFYQGQQMTLLDEAEIYRINAFDWAAEFPEIMAAGGFDAVIGNPPYGYLFGKEESSYLSEKYPVFASISDAYVAFVQKAHELLRNNRRFGFIIPSALLGGPSYEKLLLRAFN
ncbi:MAG: Eco57I restriction-modification methylase domain-containing protein [Desulfobacteraceae bacterium]